MEIISNPTQGEIKKAAKALKDGHLVAFPTETVYGLGADATNEKAVSRIYSVKGRPTDHPLIVHISSINQLDKWAIQIPEYATNLAEEFWPGPMTLIVKKSNLAKDFITGGQDNIGLRVPDQPEALKLLSEFEKLGGLGISAPSANRFGAVSPTTSQHVREEIGKYFTKKDLIIDGGQCKIGVESTIIDCTSNFPVILRPGYITLEMIRKIISINVNLGTGQSDIKSPGNLKYHYSPKAKIIISPSAKAGEGFIAMSNILTLENVIRLASPTTVGDYAAELYSALRRGDELGIKVISICPPHGDGLALAIRDRIYKAAGI